MESFSEDFPVSNGSINCFAIMEDQNIRSKKFKKYVIDAFTFQLKL